MINNKKAGIYLLLITFALSPLLVFGYLNYQKNHFSCQAEAVISKDNTLYTAMMNYHFNGGAGTVDTTGYFKKDGADLAKINKTIAFRYWETNDTLTMVSSYLHEDSDKEKLFNTLTPDFFLYSDRGVTFQLKKQTGSSYLFIQNDTPLFSCVINRT